MARIPITEIPNAPQAGAPVLASQLPGVPDAIPINMGPGLDGSGLQKAQGILSHASDSISQSASNVARATAATKKDLIDPAPFTAPGKAAAFVGEALSHAGNVAAGFANDMMQAKESMDMTRVDTILRDARDQHQLDIEQNQLSPSAWVPKWNERQSDVMEQIEALKISPRIKGQVAADVARFWGEQTNRFAIASTRRSISDARDESKVSIERAFNDGDWEIADKLITEKVGSKIFSEAEGDQLRMQLESKQRDELVNTAISADPKAVLDEMESARQDGKSKAFPWLDAAQRIRVEGMARQQFHQQQTDAIENADASIVSGEFTTPEQVQKFGEENDLDVGDIQDLKKSLLITVASTPEGKAKYQHQLGALDSLVDQYNPAADPTGDKYRALRSQIRNTAIPDDREQFTRPLDSKRREGAKPNQDLQSELISFVDKLQSDRLINAAGFDEKNKVIEKEAGAASESVANQALLKTRIRQMLKDEPGISPADAMERVQGMVRPALASGIARRYQAAATESRGWFESVLRFSAPRLPGLIPSPFEFIDAREAREKSTQTTNDAMKNTAATIVNYEARRDSDGKIKVYKLPSGDGGGTFEVAGINDRYHPEIAARLKSLIEQGKQDQAEQEATDYIAHYTAPIANKATNPGVQFAIQDAAFNRGLGGATKILQRALGVDVDGKFGPKTKAALEEAEKDPKALIKKFRAAREAYERETVKRNESSKFWKGLVNRWNNQERDALAMA